MTVDDQASLMRSRAGLSKVSSQLKYGKAATWALTFMTSHQQCPKKGRESGAPGFNRFPEPAARYVGGRLRTRCRNARSAGALRHECATPAAPASWLPAGFQPRNETPAPNPAK